MREFILYLSIQYMIIMKTNLLTNILYGAFTFVSCTQPAQLESLVPNKPSKAPDYFCTWNLQAYVVNYENSNLMRSAMLEENIFGKGQYQNWISFYPKIQEDLYFVMDDSWDIPKGENSKKDNPYLGTTELNESRFPSFIGTPEERLKKLNERVKSEGWKGVGGWICAQKSDLYPDIDEKDYWIERLKAANYAGVEYWKVDWGQNSRNDEWRKMLTQLGKKHAPNLWIEHAMKNQYIEFCDVFRTYDVENIIAQPVTINRVCDLLTYRANSNAKGIINCEDEPYIAVGLGCAIGIMRHPLTGNLPNGKQDEAFPPVGHNYKKCLDEVVRAIRWHRIAEPFAVNADCQTDSIQLTDSWEIHENETWNKSRKIGSIISESAPARISRGMELPIVNDTTSIRPYILASRYPNGAIALAAIGRTLHREYLIKPVSVTIKVTNVNTPVGIFGTFEKVTLSYPINLNPSSKVLAQDLAGDVAINITDKISFKRNQLTVPGEVINEVGTMAATPGDLSSPGMVIIIK